MPVEWDMKTEGEVQFGEGNQEFSLGHVWFEVPTEEPHGDAQQALSTGDSSMGRLGCQVHSVKSCQTG